MHPRLKRILQNTLLVTMSVILTLSIIEGFMRAFAQKLDVDIARYASTIDLLRSAYPIRYDPHLGWIPEPGTSGKENVWGTQVTIDNDGLRSNGTEKAARDRPLTLVVGDSFAFGDQVSDQETFPAVLEKLTGSRVLNGGVFAYGLDQIYLRALQLIEKFNPDIIVVSIYPDDVSRCELNIRLGIAKPYFSFAPNSQELQLMNVPVPRTIRSARVLRNVLSYSYLASYIMLKRYPEFWMTGTFLGNHAVHQLGGEIAIAILKKFDDIALQKNMHIMVLILHNQNSFIDDYIGPSIAKIIQQRHLSRLAFLDTRHLLAPIFAKEPRELDSLFYGTGGHMTGKGNALIAKYLYERMKLIHWL